MSKIQDFMDKRNIFFWSLSINTWVSFATWLHLEAPPENIEKINKHWLSNIELVLAHMILKLGMLDIAGELSVPFVTICKKNSKKIENLLLRCCSNPINYNMIDRNFKD